MSTKKENENIVIDKNENIENINNTNQNPINNQPQPSPLYYDINGQPVFAQGQNQTVNIKKPKKIGPFVAAILTFVAAVIFNYFSIVTFLAFISSPETEVGSLLMFLLYMVTGTFLYLGIPAIGFSIAALCCSCSACKSSIKAIKIISIFLIILSSLCVIASVILPFILPYTFNAG